MLWFRTPEKVYFKKGCMPVALDELGTVMHKKKAFIVTDSFLYKNGYVKPIEDKLDQIVQKIYGGNKAVLTAAAQKQVKQLTDLGFGNAPICMAKTQYSLTDDPKKLGAPKDFDITVRNLKVSAGAGFIVALTGDIMTMPGLPKVPAAERIDVDDEGRITGLF